MQAERGETMQIVCPSCNRNVGNVGAAARLILTVHCPFDGTDFGVAVDAEPVAEMTTGAADAAAPAATAGTADPAAAPAAAPAAPAATA
jgi:hypothetical protein